MTPVPMKPIFGRSSIEGEDQGDKTEEGVQLEPLDAPAQTSQARPIGNRDDIGHGLREVHHEMDRFIDVQPKAEAVL